MQISSNLKLKARNIFTRKIYMDRHIEGGILCPFFCEQNSNSDWIVTTKEWYNF